MGQAMALHQNEGRQNFAFGLDPDASEASPARQDQTGTRRHQSPEIEVLANLPGGGGATHVETSALLPSY